MVGRLVLLTFLVVCPFVSAAEPTTAGSQPSTQPATQKIDVLERRLERAKANFASAVEGARRRLEDEVEAVAAAYERADKPSLALAARQSVKDFLASTTQPVAVVTSPRIQKPQVQDGWTILFRSSNPLLWDVDVQNRDSYAVPVSTAPTFDYVRVKRMDTGDFVIVRCESFRLPDDIYARPFFRGDKRLNKQACVLGVVDVTRPVDHNHVPGLAVTPRGTFSGWGFGCWEAREGQAWVWDGKPLKETVMEIAVTRRALKPDEESQLIKG